jgi:intein-encoded DNA endonuclease-like protein
MSRITTYMFTKFVNKNREKLEKVGCFLLHVFLRVTVTVNNKYIQQNKITYFQSLWLWNSWIQLRLHKQISLNECILIAGHGLYTWHHKTRHKQRK